MAALRTALPQLQVTCEATVCHSYGLRSVSGHSTRILLTGTVSSSAATCAMTVSRPWPISMPETSTFRLASSLNLMMAEEEALGGMAGPFHAPAKPRPMTLFGSLDFSFLPCSMALATASMHLGSWFWFISAP